MDNDFAKTFIKPLIVNSELPSSGLVKSKSDDIYAHPFIQSLVASLPEIGNVGVAATDAIYSDPNLRELVDPLLATADLGGMVESDIRQSILSELRGVEGLLEQSIAALAASGQSSDAQSNALARVGLLQRQVSSAKSGDLAALKSDVSRFLGDAQHVIQLAGNAGAAKSEGAAKLEAVSAIARSEAFSAMAEMPKYDPYLQFSGEEDEATYRRREAERQARFNAETAKNTPEGNLNAAGAAVGQMADAGAHGATNSPEFQQRWDALVEITQKLRDQCIREGRNVAEFDRSLRDDLRRIMKAKGLTDAEIDARFAAHPDNPLAAAKDYIADVQGVDRLADHIKLNEASATEKTAAVAVVDPVTPTISSAEDAMAALRAAGVVVADQSGGAPAHGVAAQLGTASTTLRSV